MMQIKDWLVLHGYTDPVEQLMYPEQGYLRAIRELKRKISQRTTYDEILPLMMQRLEDFELDLSLEQDKKIQIKLDREYGYE